MAEDNYNLPTLEEMLAQFSSPQDPAAPATVDSIRSGQQADQAQLIKEYLAKLAATDQKDPSPKAWDPEHPWKSGVKLGALGLAEALQGYAQIYGGQPTHPGMNYLADVRQRGLEAQKEQRDKQREAHKLELAQAFNLSNQKTEDLMKEMETNQQFARDVAVGMAKDPESARQMVLDHINTMPEVSDQTSVGPTVSRKANVDEAVADMAKKLGLPPEQAATVKQMLKSQVAVGTKQVSDEFIDRRKGWLTSMDAIMGPDNIGAQDPRTDKSIGDTVAKQLGKDKFKGLSGADVLSKANTKSEIDQVGAILHGIAQDRAMKARTDTTTATGLRADLSYQNRLLQDARKAGVDFNQLSIADVTTGEPLILDGKEITKPLQKDGQGKLHPEVLAQLENEVASSQSTDPKQMDLGLRSFKQEVADARADVDQFVQKARKQGLTAQQLVDSWMRRIDSQYGLIGKWRSEAVNVVEPLLNSYRNAYGEPTGEPGNYSMEAAP